MDVVHRKRVGFAYLTYKYLMESSERRCWVHPFVSARLLKGAFVTTFADLRNDELKFYNYFRMSIKSFNELSARLRVALKLQDTKFRLAITPLEMLAVTLRYLGSGCTLIDSHYQNRLGRSTLSKIVRRVCRTMWGILRKECIPDFTEEIWCNIATRFEKRPNFPNCYGAVDGTHIRIEKPQFRGSQHFHYKKFHSIFDSNYSFTYIEVGSCGRESDSTIFENSKLYLLLVNDQAHIPKRRPLPGTTGPPMPFTFIGD
ncbi:hypothetical protein PR048_005012 [Dryococelus australis]|uniref:DDE Tnp4 domain-containing protein n=1 Tax=Dryococelus australis TaxID=614101 RepID=A0ABQ9I7G3_9NEOP|nr:hypothetical protein PR048_005012 [Dryococelus australis]